MIDQPHIAGCECVACKYAVLASQERFDRPRDRVLAPPYTRDQLNRAADELAEQVNAATERAQTAEHQLLVLAEFVLDDDLVAARNYLTELGFGMEVFGG